MQPSRPTLAPTTTDASGQVCMISLTNPPKDDDPEDALPETLFDQASCQDRGFCSVNTDAPAAPFKIYYELHGEGPTKVIFIMGLKNCSFSWSRQVEALGRNPEYSVLVFDNRGAGFSDTPRGPYTTGAMARDALNLLDYVGWVREREVHCVGVSMGGMIALKLAALEPLRVASLLLAVTTAGHGIRRKLPPLDGLELTARTLFENELERYMLMLYPQSWLDEVDSDDSEGRTNRETRIEEHLRRVKVTPGQTVLGQWWQLAATTTHHVTNQDLERINSSIPKICILSAKNDTLIPPDSSTNLKKHMSDAELVVWQESGHAIHSQFPTRFNELCERIFREGREAAGAPRLQRADSMTFYRERAHEEQQAASATTASFYPRGLTELIDRYWTTVAHPSASTTHTAAPSIASSPEKKRPTPGHLRLPAATGPSSGKVVSFAEKEDSDDDESPPEPQSHVGLRDLVERVMRDKRDVEADENGEPHRHRFHDLVDRVLAPIKPSLSTSNSHSPSTPSSHPPPPSSIPLPMSPSDISPVSSSTSFFGGLPTMMSRRSKSRDPSPTRKASLMMRTRRASELVFPELGTRGGGGERGSEKI